ncbi:STM4504/CBY_0614 family protein [Sphingopyxis fribergensis]
MAIFNLFSKRQADAAKSGSDDVYQYDVIPQPLRVQVQQIAVEAIGRVGFSGDGFSRGDQENETWVRIERLFLREKGLDSIAYGDFAGTRILAFTRDCPTADWLDFLELISVGIAVMANDSSRLSREKWQVSTIGQAAIDEINYRMREAGVGYQLEEGRLIRVDSQYVHSEVVKPALALLSDKGFEGPRQEFLAAHQHYRAGEHRQAVGMAANALESTFKAIFDQKGWKYEKGARISDLVKIGRANALWPEYLDASFDQLLATLQSGLPKIRDNDASHGQGAKPKAVPAYIAAYALHLAASKIIFITEAAK